ncbi:uncharacterized protein TNCV_1388421 [Trichonephila clavipes]|nr:uncharacterized protein TNCV_1388421 [Trichonephila clavipes]
MFGEKVALSSVTFMKDVATIYTANPVKKLLIQTFEKERIITKHCKFPWSPWSPDLTLADVWLWVYLKSLVYRSLPSNLSKLKDVIHRDLSCIQSEILHSAVAGYVKRLQCVIPCGGHVKHILL